MASRFITDGNVPFWVRGGSTWAGHGIATVSEAAHPGLRNDELATPSIQLGMVILTRDADFTRLRQPSRTPLALSMSSSLA
ncbi:DUF5615 family PIN-like protein [Candidatus Bathyarchaeota archaeon]|nr:DUF5615 family PIN-like protein [Candidatus Bathyarchaeota archaeon]